MNAPTIAVLFQQTVSLGVAKDELVTALQAYVDEFLSPAWGVHAQLTIREGTIPDGSWPLLFANDSDQAQALGYHELVGQRPTGFVFVATSATAGISVAETASHELAELLLDPGANLAARSPRGRWVAREICDPVQGETITVNGLQMADFVLPSWYGAGGAPFDAQSVCHQAWEVLPGGYVPVWDEGSGEWTPVFASREGQAMYAKRGGGEPLKRIARRSRSPREDRGRLLL